MLQAIRERFIGWALWTLIGFIVVPFAFFGIESFRTNSGDPTLAKVGGQRITQSQVGAAYDSRLAQLQSLLGENFRQDQIDPVRFREAVLATLVQEATLSQYTREQGYRASDAQLFEALQTIPSFQEDGKFSSEIYRSRLAAQGYSPERFETQLRSTLIADQVRDGVLATALVADDAVADAARLNAQKRWIAYARFPLATYRNQVNVTEAQVRARYDEQASRFQAPERVRLAYLELSPTALAETTSPGADVLRAIYDTEKAARYTTPEQRAARHILIPFGGDKSVAKKQADDLAAQLDKGADFVELAAQYSSDTGSKKKGGALGWIRKGQMTAKFESALFALKKGQRSAPIETEFGWHLIELTGLRAEQVRPFEDAQVQDELLTTYRVREADKRFQEMADKLEQLAFESPTSLEPASKALGLSVQTTDWVKRGDLEGLMATPALRDAAFSPEVIQDGENSKPLGTAAGHVVVLRKLDHEPPRLRPLEEVAVDIREELRNEAARQRARDAAAATLEAVRSGRAALETAAQAQGGQLVTLGLIGRDANDKPAAVLNAAFRLPKPVKGVPSVAEATLADNEPAVVAVTAVQEPEAPSVDELQAAGRALRDAQAGAEFAAYRGYIQGEVKVKMMAPPETPAEAPAP